MKLGDFLHLPLFRPEGLCLEFLGCISDIPPLAPKEFEDANVALVVENAAATVRQVLKEFSFSPSGLLGFDSGIGFGHSVLHFQFLERQITRIEYLRDLDRLWLRIACGAARLASTEKLPLVVPAQGLHQAMLGSSKFLVNRLEIRGDLPLC